VFNVYISSGDLKRSTALNFPLHAVCERNGHLGYADLHQQTPHAGTTGSCEYSILAQSQSDSRYPVPSHADYYNESILLQTTGEDTQLATVD